MKLITLMTDFGQRDGYTGIMKGVILRIAPDAQFVDLTHEIPPQNVLQGALVWSRSCSFFPEGAIHVGVVDPGVGTARRPIAARIGTATYVCPDNGLITLILESAEAAGEPVELVELNQPRFWLPEVSNVFHGRDIFAPVAAHLANGVPLREVGHPIDNPVRKHPPTPQQLPHGWRGEVVEIDHFGNLGTNLAPEHLQGAQTIRFKIAGQEIHGLSRTFGDRTPGELTALIDSSGMLAVAVVNGSAARKMGVEVGEPVEVHLVD